MLIENLYGVPRGEDKILVSNTLRRKKVRQSFQKNLQTESGGGKFTLVLNGF